jgi:hypothetical protein
MGYLWFRTWQDDANRLWAERFLAGDPSEAKQHHADDLRFAWARSGDRNPAVSDLTFHNETGSTVIVKEGKQREPARQSDRQGDTPTPQALAALLIPTAPAPVQPDSSNLPF